MAGHAQLKFVMTECSKTQIRLTRSNYFFFSFAFCLENKACYVICSNEIVKLTESIGVQDAKSRRSAALRVTNRR